MEHSYANKIVLITGGTSGIGKATAIAFSEIMNVLIKILTKLGLLKEDLDYHLVRASKDQLTFAVLSDVGNMVARQVAQRIKPVQNSEFFFPK